MNDETLASYDNVIKLNLGRRSSYIAKVNIYEAERIGKIYFYFSYNMFVLIYLGKCYYKAQNYTKVEEIF